MARLIADLDPDAVGRAAKTEMDAVVHIQSLCGALQQLRGHFGLWMRCARCQARKKFL